MLVYQVSNKVGYFLKNTLKTLKTLFFFCKNEYPRQESNLWPAL